MRQCGIECSPLVPQFRFRPGLFRRSGDLRLRDRNPRFPQLLLQQPDFRVEIFQALRLRRFAAVAHANIMA